MEDFLIVLLCAVVLWLVIKQSEGSAQDQAIEELRKLLEQLERRLTKLERGTPPVEHATVQPDKPSEPTPAAEVVIRPAAPAYRNLRPYEPSPIYTSAANPPLEPKPLAAVVRSLAEPAQTPPPPVVLPFAQPEPTRSISLEERLGQNWLNKLGIISLVIGIALFLGYQLRTLGPLGKSLMGFAVSAILLAGGLWLERREQYRIFARAGIGGGWALTFFVTFALYHVQAMQVLQSQAADLVLMLLVAAGMVAHSLHYKSQVVTSLAFLLAFVTVGISEVTLFSLVAGALLAISLVIVAARERWYILGLCGLVGVYLNHYLWLLRVLPNGGVPGHPFPEFLPSAGLLLLYWLLFRLFYVLRVPEQPQDQMVASLTAILNSAGLLYLLKYQSSHPEWAFAGLLVLGVAEFGFAFLGRTRWRTSFILLSTIASALMFAAIPFRFSGAHWTLLWLLEAEVLFLAGVRIPEKVFRRLGMLAAILSALQLFAMKVMPIITLRAAGDDPSRHISAAVPLFCAALLFWLNAEFATRRWKQQFEDDLDAGVMLFTSYLAATMLTLGLWVAFPAAWTVVAWLAAALLLGFIADALSSIDLASQADYLAVVALIRIAVINFNLSGAAPTEHLSLRAITVLLASALLYAGMRRRTGSRTLPAEFIAATYAWSAAAVLAVLIWLQVPSSTIAIAWGVFGLALFELGALTRRSYFRHQAYLLFFASFARIFYFDLDFGSGIASPHHRLYTVVPLIAAYLWVYERTQRSLSDSEVDVVAGTGAAWLGMFAAGALLYVQLPAVKVAIAWAGLAAVLLHVAWALRRGLFIAQSLTVLAATAANILLEHLLADQPPASPFWTSRWFYVGAPCLLMLLSLPAAFAIRRHRLAAENPSDNPILTHPEQPFLFVPLGLLTILLSVELHGGRITVGWIALGLAAFLAALPIGERSYRLAGLGLLLLGLAKIIVVDIWSASPTDRYLTLIIMGISMLLVSFLYSRFRETILKFL